MIWPPGFFEGWENSDGNAIGLWIAMENRPEPMENVR